MNNKAFGMPNPQEVGVIPGSTEPQKTKPSSPDQGQEPQVETDQVAASTSDEVLKTLKSGGLHGHSNNFRDADRNVC